MLGRLVNLTAQAVKRAFSTMAYPTDTPIDTLDICSSHVAPALAHKTFDPALIGNNLATCVG